MEDPGLNEVDEFATRNEHILLENSTLRNNKQNYTSDEDDEEEIMNIDSGSESEDDDDDDEAVDDEEAEKAYRQVFGRSLKQDQKPLTEEELDDEAMINNENAWGDNKNEYYGADELDDDETAKEIEKEGLRQQKKHLEELNMNDYLDEEVEEEWVQNAKDFELKEFQETAKVQDSFVSIKDVINMDSEARKEFFGTMFPEFEPLTMEFNKLNETLLELQKQELNTNNLKIKIMAVSTYLGTIASYLGILLHEFKNNEDFTTMKEHPVMEAILTSKEIWRQANELPMEDFDQSDIPQEQLSDDEDMEMDGKLDNIDEIDDNLLSRVPVDENSFDSDNSDSIKDDDNEDAEDEEDEADLDDFEEYVAQSRITKSDKSDSKKFNKRIEDADDFVESEMADVDAQEKKARKRSLRFYTSKIDQQEQKKKYKFTGDDDIPYKERFFERQQRLLEEARKRGLHDALGDDLDNKDFDINDENVSKSINEKGSDDYYKQIQQQRQQRKDTRKEAHKVAVLAAREGKLSEVKETIGEDGKRAINYQILKNKGLTPKRKKDNRNSRVKKRKKYEKAQKKLKSVRAVYSGGQSGIYEGEKTGIKKNLTKSVKFKN